jgi:hypothetical protein
MRQGIASWLAAATGVGIALLTSCANHEAAGAPTTWFSRKAGSDALFGVFESRFPCLDQQALERSGCQRVKFGLALFVDPVSRRPTRFEMTRIYVGSDETRLRNEGQWAILKETAADQGKRAIELDEGAPPDFQKFWLLSNDVIIVVDRTGMPRVGDAGYGYAASRINPQ